MTTGAADTNEGPEPGRQPGWCSHLFVSDQDRQRGRYGSSCRARPLVGKDLCAAHDPQHQRTMTDRRTARQVAREEWKTRIRTEQAALKESAFRRAQAEIAQRQASREAARAARQVPRSVRIAHRRAQLHRPERLRIQLYLRPDEVAALHDWFERRCDGDADAATG